MSPDIRRIVVIAVVAYMLIEFYSVVYQVGGPTTTLYNASTNVSGLDAGATANLISGANNVLLAWKWSFRIALITLLLWLFAGSQDEEPIETGMYWGP